MNASTLEPSSVQALAGKYLTFSLGDESYGIAVLKIREIIRLTSITAVPQMPDYVKGVINLRGKLFLWLACAPSSAWPRRSPMNAPALVVQIELASHTKALVGLIVDGVEEVAYIGAQDIEQTPDFGANLDTEYILGMAKVKNVVKALLDIDKVVSADTLELLEAKTAH